jgi:hypothetical protein
MGEMPNWKPDLTPEQFQHILDSPINWGSLIMPAPRNPRPWNMCGLNPKAWYMDDDNKLYIYIPWNREPMEKLEYYRQRGMIGHVLPINDTQRLVIDYIVTYHGAILDIGGYDGIWSWLFEAERKVLVDLCEETVERWGRLHMTECYVENGADIGDRFSDDEFDLVLLMDVMEHMTTEDALKCLEAAERIAKYQLIVATPDGWLPYDETNPNYQSLVASGTPCKEAMLHHSGWGHEFFEERGYRVFIQKNLHEPIGGGDGLVAFLDK